MTSRHTSGLQQADTFWWLTHLQTASQPQHSMFSTAEVKHADVRWSLFCAVLSPAQKKARTSYLFQKAKAIKWLQIYRTTKSAVTKKTAAWQRWLANKVCRHA